MYFSCSDNDSPSNLNNSGRFSSLADLHVWDSLYCRLHRFQHYNSHAFAMRIQKAPRLSISKIKFYYNIVAGRGRKRRVFHDWWPGEFVWIVLTYFKWAWGEVRLRRTAHLSNELLYYFKSWFEFDWSFDALKIMVGFSNLLNDCLKSFKKFQHFYSKFSNLNSSLYLLIRTFFSRLYSLWSIDSSIIPIMFAIIAKLFHDSIKQSFTLVTKWLLNKSLATQQLPIK